MMLAGPFIERLCVHERPAPHASASLAEEHELLPGKHPPRVSSCADLQTE